MQCPVCISVEPRYFMGVENRDYWRCGTCLATFLDPAQLPSADIELAQYLLHHNDPDDAGYRRFLGQLATPLLQRLPAEQYGLDYGCGPGPALAAMLREAGHSVELFDPCFHPNQRSLTGPYDFITCTEAAEHFHNPAAEFRKLDRLLKPGGWLGLMTCFQNDDARFAGWYYRRDPTHVVFFREATFRCVANEYRWSCEFPCHNVALIRKGPLRLL